MSRIQLTVETTNSVAECRTFITEQILTRPEAQMLLNEAEWIGDTLHASGSLGSGTIDLLPGQVVIDIELSMFGAAAKGRIEEALTEQFNKLP